MVLHQLEADHPAAEELQEGLAVALLHPRLIAVLVRVAEGEGEVGVVTLAAPSLPSSRFCRRPSFLVHQAAATKSRIVCRFIIVVVAFT